MWIVFFAEGRVGDVIYLPFSKNYRVGLIASNGGTFQLTEEELKVFLFTQTCVILSGVLAAREGQPLVIQQRFSKIYEILSVEYEKLQ
ncbi:hypothetical protein F9U42_09240 [Pectobacterium versatile]|uniref:hypothetical protein n=1 Tax=Pectobacterium versatile TaxID=2488639 RepID=UPI001B36F90A|nr:hypothetical protein [Pectobacterium versatile]MBQ4767318.1 hypothetical protein [Pectobacterium versatile]